jgi:hypothetical protein
LLLLVDNAPLDVVFILPYPRNHSLGRPPPIVRLENRADYVMAITSVEEAKRLLADCGKNCNKSMERRKNPPKNKKMMAIKNRGNNVENTDDENCSPNPIKSSEHSFIDIGMHSFRIVRVKPRGP